MAGSSPPNFTLPWYDNGEENQLPWYYDGENMDTNLVTNDSCKYKMEII